jgi:hypothetical protein
MPPVILEMCSSHPTTHIHHAWVHEPIDAIKLRVEEATMALAIPVNILALSGPYWLDNWALLKGPSWGTERERLVLQNLNSLVHTKLNLIIENKDQF